VLTGFLFADLSRLFQYYIFYSSSARIVLASGMTGFFLGNIFGKRLFNKHENYRSIFTVSGLLFLLFSIIYLTRNYFPFVEKDPLLSTFFILPVLPLFLISIAALFPGIMCNYLLKLSCGNYIDDTHGLYRFLGFSTIGFALGGGLSYINLLIQHHYLVMLALPVMIIPAIFIINLPYSPSPFYAKDYAEKPNESRMAVDHRDNLIFTYLNFSFSVFYVFLAYISMIKYYGNLIHVKIFFMFVTAVSLALGTWLGKFIKKSDWHVYFQAAFPVLFLVFHFAAARFCGMLEFYSGGLLFAPPVIFFGIALNHTIQNIMDNYSHGERFNIIEFSLFKLPVPIVLALGFIPFTGLWYYVLLYFAAAVSIILPSIHLVNRNTKEYLKAVYFIYPLIMVPALIFVHIYYKIPLSGSIYAARIENFDELRNVNYNLPYIKSREMIRMDGYPVFNLSDSPVRNLKRALIPLCLYIPEKEWSRMLFIDGNQRFFRNPVIGYYKNSVCIDPLSDDDVDYNTLPMSGKQKYVSDPEDLLYYLYGNGKKFSMVVDIPNLTDQNFNSFRFSKEYYSLIKKHSSPQAVFAQVFSLQSVRPGAIIAAVANLKSVYRNHCIYLFSNIMLIMASDGEKPFSIGKTEYERLVSLMKDHPDQGVFYNEAHVVSHFYSTKLDDVLKLLRPEGFNRWPYAKSRLRIDRETAARFLDDNRRVLDLAAKSNDFQNLQVMTNSIASNDRILSLFKKTEFAESNENYEDETKFLFELKNQAEYVVYLREYISGILSYKEEYYFSAGLRFEKEKRWLDARTLYGAILAINKNNFEANYRLGILYLTLQDIDNAFKYLHQAMALKSDNPRVLFQMGVLLYSNGKIKEAVEYFQKSLQNKGESASLYRYLGICYEKLDNIQEAENYYSKAVLADPNDIDIKTRLDLIKKGREKEKKDQEMPEQKNDFEVEQDTEMPLPINKSAYEIRLKDNDTTLPVLNGETGSEATQGTQDKKQKEPGK
jgi:tetratricopeptide (TPR) repeat protein